MAELRQYTLVSYMTWNEGKNSCSPSTFHGGLDMLLVVSVISMVCPSEVEPPENHQILEVPLAYNRNFSGDQACDLNPISGICLNYPQKGYALRP